MTHPAPATLAERLRQGIDLADIPDAEREMDKAATRIDALSGLLEVHGCITRPGMTVGECIKDGLCACSCGLLIEPECA